MPRRTPCDPASGVDPMPPCCTPCTLQPCVSPDLQVYLHRTMRVRPGSTATRAVARLIWSGTRRGCWPQAAPSSAD